MKLALPAAVKKKFSLFRMSQKSQRIVEMQRDFRDELLKHRDRWTHFCSRFWLFVGIPLLTSGIVVALTSPVDAGAWKRYNFAWELRDWKDHLADEFMSLTWRARIAQNSTLVRFERSLKLFPDPLMSDGRERDPEASRTQHASIYFELPGLVRLSRTALGHPDVDESDTAPQYRGPTWTPPDPMQEAFEHGVKVQPWMLESFELSLVAEEEDSGQMIVTRSSLSLGNITLVRVMTIDNSTWIDCKYRQKGQYNADASTCLVFDLLEELCVKVQRSPSGKWLGDIDGRSWGCHIDNLWRPEEWRRLEVTEEDIAAAAAAAEAEAAAAAAAAAAAGAGAGGGLDEGAAGGGGDNGTSTQTSSVVFPYIIRPGVVDPLEPATWPRFNVSRIVVRSAGDPDILAEESANWGVLSGERERYTYGAQAFTLITLGSCGVFAGILLTLAEQGILALETEPSS